MVLKSPLIIDAVIKSAAQVKGAQAANVPAGAARFYVIAQANALIRGTEALPQRIAFLVDVPLDWRKRPPKLNKKRVLLFALPARGDGSEVQLAGPDGMRDWTPEAEALVRRITKEVLDADAPPAVTGVGNAFYVPGSLPGEGETQVFLNTKSGQPISISVLHRPGEQPRWAVALGEIVDEAAGPPKRDTLLWYRLACALPPALPSASTATLSGSDAAQARKDYAMVLGALGSCDRHAGT